MKSLGVWVLGAWFGALTLACSSSSSDTPAAPACNTQAMPKTFTVSGVSPAMGASVPNMDIVEKFTIAEPLALDRFSVLTTAAHTAGNEPVGTQFGGVQNADGSISYSSTPITWQMAGQVEFSFVDIYQRQSDGCYYAFPKPMFSYTVTAP
jgi:hypothetical protein